MVTRLNTTTSSNFDDKFIEPKFRSWLRESPKDALLSILDGNELEMDLTNVEIKVMTSTNETYYIPISEAEDHQFMSPEDLITINAAGTTSTAGTAGTASSFSTASSACTTLMSVFGTIGTASSAGSAGSID